jgi:hypothetical protein
MHQTFYIDVDEEISSVIDRLKKSMAFDNYFVVPRRAIFLQSIVNLKLLKREAEKAKKHVILVTQEEVVAAMAARSGVDVRSSIEGLDKILDSESEVVETKSNELPSMLKKENVNKSGRLSNIGTNDFFDVQQVVNPSSSRLPKREDPKNVVRVGAKDYAEQYPKPDFPQQQKEYLAKDIYPRAVRDSSAQLDRQSQSQKELSFKKLDAEKEKTLERMYLKKQQSPPPENEQISNGKTKNFFFIFIIFSLFLLAGVAGYLYIPSATIIIKPKEQIVRVDINARLEQGQQTEGALPLRVIDRQEQLTLQYSATGKSATSGKKAQGVVVLYNEFDNQPQTLVATTRIQTEDGKIFRLLKTVVIPGLSVIGGQSKPGAISTEVIADQPGADYNLQASDFKILGFQGGPKYAKFYAKSSIAFSGGTTEGEAIAGISQSDLDSAKQKTELALKAKMTEIINGQLQAGEVALLEATKVTLDKSAASSKLGDVAQAFDYTVTAKVQALVFIQTDIEKLIEKTPQFSEQPKDAIKNIKSLEYVSVEPSFEDGSLLLKVHSEIEVTPGVDLELFKREALGKNENELLLILKKYQNIESANLLFSPTFITRIPQFPNRVSIELEKK